MQYLSAWGSIFFAFLQIGLLGFGGGPGSVGVIQAVTVDTYRWLTPQEFAQGVAVGNSLPGPLLTKMAAWIGYRVGGAGGAVAALLGVVLPSALLMLALFALIDRYRTNPYVAGALQGIRPVVAVLLLLLVWELLPRQAPHPQQVLSAALGVAALLALTVARVPAVAVVVGGMVAGALLLRPGS
jgi:chromate transporter